MNQFQALAVMLRNPKQAMLELPSNQFYPLAFFIVLATNYLLAIHSSAWFQNSSSAQYKVLFFLFFTLCVGFFFLLQWLLIAIILGLFKKKLTTEKIVNLIGYAWVPALSLNCIFWLFDMAVQFVVQAIALRHLVWIYNSINLLTMVAGIYTYALLIYGLVISPPEPEPAPGLPEK